MALPLAISTLFSNSRHEIVVSQIMSAVVGVFLGPGCLIFSFLPVNALPEYRTALMIGGSIITLLLSGLIYETRRKLALADRIIQAFDTDPSSIGRIFALKDKNNLSSACKLRVELKDGTSTTLPVSEEDYNALMNYLRTKFPAILKETSIRPNF